MIVATSAFNLGAAEPSTRRQLLAKVASASKLYPPPTQPHLPLTRIRSAFTTHQVAAVGATAAPLAAFAGPRDGLQDGKRVNEWGSAVSEKTIIGANAASNQAGRKGGTIPKIRVSGTWLDPGHPGCTRKIAIAGNKAIITGADEDQKPWKVVGLIDGNDIIIDFSPKGGPKDVTAVFKTGVNKIVFPDGNVWSKQA